MNKNTKKMNCDTFTMLGITLILVKNKYGKYLSVLEQKNRGWWMPGGRVDPPESFQEAAIRETKEEGGIDIELKGVLRLETAISKDNFQRIKVVFYAEPADENQVPKKFEDKESIKAEYLTLDEIRNLKHQRGPELVDWAEYVDQGGVIYPLEVLAEEGSTPVIINNDYLQGKEEEIQQLKQRIQDLELEIENNQQNN